MLCASGHDYQCRSMDIALAWLAVIIPQICVSKSVLKHKKLVFFIDVRKCVKATIPFYVLFYAKLHEGVQLRCYP